MSGTRHHLVPSRNQQIKIHMLKRTSRKIVNKFPWVTQEQLLPQQFHRHVDIHNSSGLKYNKVLMWYFSNIHCCLPVISKSTIQNQQHLKLPWVLLSKK